MKLDRCYVGDTRDGMREFIAQGLRAQTVVTSPPYWGLRDYGVAGQIGLEDTPAAFVERMVEVFRLVRDLLADDGTLWLNMGDSYAGSWGAQSREHAGKHAPNVSALSANQVIAAQRRQSNTGSIPAGSGLKPKDLVGMPWRLAFALQADGWYLRSDIIWHKPNPMPESVTDRPTKAHEYLFLLAKSERYYYDADAIKEPCTQDEFRPTFRGGAYVNGATFDNAQGGQSTVVGNVKRSGNKERKLGDERGRPDSHIGGSIPWEGSTRNKRTVWPIATEPFPDAHFATFPTALVEPCILAGSRVGDTVFDPFMGSGTVAQVAQNLGRRWLGCELNPAYVAMQSKRAAQQGLVLA